MAAYGPHISGGNAYNRTHMGLMPSIWYRGGNQGFPFERIREYPTAGVLVGTTFKFWVGTAIASNRGNYWSDDSGWTSREGAGTAGTIQSISGDEVVGTGAGSVKGLPGQNAFLAPGTIELASGAAAHNSTAMELGGSAAGAAANGMFAVPATATVTIPIAGSFPRVYFETRLRFPQTTNTSMFVGLAAPGKTSAINTVFSASDVFVVMNCIGFAINAVASTSFVTSATQIQPFYCTSGGAATVLAASTNTGFQNAGGIPSTANYAGQTLTPAVAGLSTDWTKVGFIFDATDSVACLRFFQDDVPLAAVTLAQLVAANWPSAVELTPLLYVQSTGAGAATSKLDVDYVYAGMVFEPG